MNYDVDNNLLRNGSSLQLLVNQCVSIDELFGILRTLVDDHLADDRYLQLTGTAILSSHRSEKLLSELGSDLLSDGSNAIKKKIALCKVGIWANAAENILSLVAELILEEDLDASDLEDLSALSLTLGQVDAAEDLLQKSILLRGNVKSTAKLKGEIYLAKGQMGEALHCFLQEKDAADASVPAESFQKDEVIVLLESMEFVEHSAVIEQLFEKVFEHSNNLDHSRLFPAIEKLLSIKSSLSDIDPIYFVDPVDLERSMRILDQEKLMNRLLRAMAIPSLQFEYLMAQVRRNCLLSLSDFNNPETISEILESIAIQSFITGFVYPEEPDESAALEKLIQDYKEQSLPPGVPKKIALLLIASYREPLSTPLIREEILLDFSSVMPSEWKKKTFFDVQEESAIASDASLANADTAEDLVSPETLKAHYPRPGGLTLMAGTLLDFYNKLGLKDPISDGIQVFSPRILIADASSATSALAWSGLTNADVEILASDLMQLGLFERIINEKGIENVSCELKIGDNGVNPEKKYDLIVCDEANVLLKRGLAEGDSLLDKLKPGGILKFRSAVNYPESSLSKIRNFLASNQSDKNYRDKQSWRATAFRFFSELQTELAKIPELFIAPSSIDLLYSNDERFVSARDIDRWIKDSGTIFCGFVFRSSQEHLAMMAQFHLVNGDNANTLDLENWESLFCEKPDLVSGYLEGFVKKG